MSGGDRPALAAERLVPTKVGYGDADATPVLDVSGLLNHVYRW